MRRRHRAERWGAQKAFPVHTQAERDKLIDLPTRSAYGIFLTAPQAAGYGPANHPESGIPSSHHQAARIETEMSLSYRAIRSQ